MIYAYDLLYLMLRAWFMSVSFVVSHVGLFQGIRGKCQASDLLGIFHVSQYIFSFGACASLGHPWLRLLRFSIMASLCLFLQSISLVVQYVLAGSTLGKGR